MGVEGTGTWRDAQGHFQDGRDAEGRWPWPDPLRTLACGWEICRAHWLEAPDLRDLAQRRLQALVEHARAESPFYRRLYAGVDPRAPVDPVTLPWVSKQQVMDNFDLVVTGAAPSRREVDTFLRDPERAGRRMHGGFAVWTSSGTSGVPGIFLHDTSALAVYDALQLFRFRGAESPLNWAGFANPLERYALVAATGGHFAGVASIERLRDMVPWERERLRVFSLMQPLEALAAQLAAFRPEVLATYPSAACMLAREQKAGRLRIAPRQVWTGGENLSAAMRREIQDAFGVPVQEEYGASEFASIGVGCVEGWLHVNADWVLLEAVDEAHRPVPAGVPSHTALLTNLANRAQPLIRYDLGDSLVFRPDPCPCGNRLPAVRVQGRHDDCVAIPRGDGSDVTLLPLVISTVLEEGAQVYDFQLAQIAPRRLDLRIAPAERGREQAALAALRAFLDARACSGVRVESSGLAPQPEVIGGKLRRIRREFHDADAPAQHPAGASGTHG